ncbi:hypothetical protein QCA50_017600 [Cerrena zonata]|uniref:Initiation factor eIF2 gamma C-terminal domain-containing protein n=1 Tax=Cerrena zonata TaxID=2478898 RepID=A0AAW0FPX3_9APHY
MSYDDIENATPDIVIGGTMEDPEEEYQYEHEVESGNEQAEEEQEVVEKKEKKSVAFSGLDDEYDEEAAKREFIEGGGLPEQPENPNFEELTPLSAEIINRQATINIGTIGHVAHGKSTVVRAISGVQTVRFKDELERNITIKLVPISAQLKYNIDAVNQFIVNYIPVPMRDFSASPRLIVIRSFDVNKPGAEIDDLKGGVAGGSILNGVFKLGDEIEIRPGIVTKDDNGKIQFPGGLIGVGTKVDPTLCRADRLVGQVVGSKGNLPSIYTDIEINYFLLRRLLGVKTDGQKQGAKVRKLESGEVLMVNIGSTATGARVVAVKADMARLQLTTPACTEVNEKIALSRRIDKHWRLIGWATIKKGNTLEPIA